MDGSTSLTEVANKFYLYNSSGTGPTLKYAGSDFVAGQFGGWTPIGAVRTATGYDVAWKVAGADQYTAWSSDSNGNYITAIIGYGVPGTDRSLEVLETTFQQDLNGDGKIGPAAQVIQVDGSTSLTAVVNHFYLYDSTGTGPTIKYGGIDVVAGQFGAWTPIGAVQTANGYDVAWKVTGADQYTVWSTDTNGNYITNLTGSPVPGTDASLEALETTFHQDLNGDGVIGLIATVVQVDGSTSLTEVANKFYLYNSSGTGPTLKYAGSDFVAGQFGGWTPIGAVRTATGYDVAWKVAGADQYTAWSSDSNGNYITAIIGYGVPGTDRSLEVLETTFQQDLNGDGKIGPAAQVIQVDGSTSLTAVVNHFYLYDSTGTGPTIKYGGIDVVAGQFGTWGPIGAVQTANGYDVAWKVTGADQYTVWSTDSNGNYIAQITGYAVPGKRSVVASP